MDKWTIVIIIAGLLVFAGIVAVNSMTVEESVEAEQDSCEVAGNSCSSSNNCGRASCGVVKGTNECGCGN